MSKPAKRESPPKPATIVRRLIEETRAVYREAGVEISAERIGEELRRVLEEHWHRYLVKELEQCCGLCPSDVHQTDMAEAIAKAVEDDDESESA